MSSLQRGLKQRARQAGHGQPMENVVTIVAGTVILAAVVLALTESETSGWPIRLYVVVTILSATMLYGIGELSVRAGRWASVVVTGGLLVTGTLLFPEVGLFYLWGLVVGLTVAAVSLRAGAVISGLGSLLVALWHLVDPTYWQGARVVVAMVGMWGAYGVICWLQTSAEGTALWAWGQFERAQQLLDEARRRRGELHQALDDLAHANRQLALANENLAALRRVAEDAQRAKAAFVSKVSHEFRTPLNMIIGLADLPVSHPELYEAPLPPTLLEDLRIVRRNSQHLLSMVNDVLDLSQVEAGQLALYRENVDLSALLRESAEVVTPLLTKKGLSLSLDIEDAMMVYCDPTRIRQVVLNLVSNAARFTEQGGIAVEARRKQGTVVVAVSDTGPGIPPEDAERIFEPFYQSKRQQRQGGTGLGLSISRQFVEQHGGRMWLETAVGEGSTFRFALPTSDAGRPRVGADRWISEQWPWVERRVRGSVPVVDASPRLVLLDTTGDLGEIVPRYAQDIEFVLAGSADETVQELKRGQSLGALVNTSSANELWPTVDRIARSVPFVPVVGCAFPPSRERAAEAGAEAYLVKPIDREVLAEILDGMPRPPQRVLVVDDDADSRFLLERMLGIWRADVEVIAVESGELALAELE
ncbi:MAG: ATP-binding protein, partial [Anaerolineae bacterium]